MVKLSRRQFLAGGATLGAAAVATDAWLVEPHGVTVTHYRLGQPGPDRSAFRLAQLSDLHLRAIGRLERRILDEVGRIAPDAMVLTGDVIDQPDRLDVLSEFLRSFDRRLSVYAILGNWEHAAGVDLARLRAIYERADVRLLVNETAVHRHGGREVLLTGMDDSTVGRPNLMGALAGVAPAPNHLLLAHSPAYRARLSRRGSPGGAPAGANPTAPTPGEYAIECMLSGHTHGGQVAPFGWVLFLPPGSGRYVSGWYRDAGEVDLYVSRGLGTSVAPVRIGSPPEIPVFEWPLA